MTKLDGMTNGEIWEQVEDCFYTISMDVGHRSYTKHSMNGARYIQHLVRKNLAWIDRALLEIDVRAAKAARVHNEDNED